MKDAADADQCGLKLAKQDQVAGSGDDAGDMTSAVATVAKVIASRIWSKIHSGNGSVPVRICSQILQSGHKKAFVPQARLAAEVLMGMDKDFDYVGFSRGRKTKLSHYPSRLIAGLARRRDCRG